MSSVPWNLALPEAITLLITGEKYKLWSLATCFFFCLIFSATIKYSPKNFLLYVTS